MRRIALLAACLVASAVLILLLVPARASALTATVPAPRLNMGAAQDNSVILARHRGGFAAAASGTVGFGTTGSVAGAAPVGA